MTATYIGLTRSESITINLIKSYGGGKFKHFFHVSWFRALPVILSGVAVTAPNAVLGSILAEFGGGSRWRSIKEIDNESFAVIGHHSHSHEYLIEKSDKEFIEDIEKANMIFKEKLGYVPELFSYPFGEYSEFMRNYISKNFTFAFGQHSGVIDLNKEKFQLPRFPINEKYGELKRFKSIINYFPLEYKKIMPDEKQLFENTNPPEFKVEFFKDQKNLNYINCYSNEGDVWERSKINFSNYILTIEFREPFKPRRGRINCSLNDNGKWRWFGVQFVIKEN